MKQAKKLRRRLKAFCMGLSLVKVPSVWDVLHTVFTAPCYPRQFTDLKRTHEFKYIRNCQMLSKTGRTRQKEDSRPLVRHVLVKVQNNLNFVILNDPSKQCARRVQ